MPGGVYAGCPADTPAISIDNLLVCSKTLPNDTVYGLLQTLFVRLDEVRKIHPEAVRLSKDYCSKGSSIEFHPGATRFYRE